MVLIGCRRGAGGVSGSAQLLPQRLVEAEDRSGVATETVRALEDGQRVLLGTTQGGGRGGSLESSLTPSLDSSLGRASLLVGQAGTLSFSHSQFSH